MEIIKEIIIAEDSRKFEKMTIREACRAVIFDDSQKMPLIFATKDKYHKLPGGGIEIGEDKKTALTRELLEETGCEAEITQEIGITIESNSTRKHTSYCYMGKIKKKGEPAFTEEEKEKGFTLKRVTINEAIELIKAEKRQHPTGKRIQKRDLAILEKAKRLQ